MLIMKKVFLVAAAIVAVSTIMVAGPRNAAKALKLKALEAKKTEYVKEIKALTAEWEKPKPEVSVEELRKMKHEYDSLVLDLNSKIVSIEMEITEVNKVAVQQ